MSLPCPSHVETQHQVGKSRVYKAVYYHLNEISTHSLLPTSADTLTKAYI